MNSIAPAAVYILCLATSLICAGLLLRAYFHDRSRLLLWTAIGFVFLAFNNLSLVADLLIFTRTDLTWLRQAATLLALGTLLYGFIWEAEQ